MTRTWSAASSLVVRRCSDSAGMASRLPAAHTVETVGARVTGRWAPIGTDACRHVPLTRGVHLFSEFPADRYVQPVPDATDTSVVGGLAVSH